jgi:hypothetical protein
MMNNTTRLTLSTLMFLVISLPASTLLAESIRTSEVSSGGCMVICDDVSFCRDFDYNRQSGTCTIFLDPANPDYSRIHETCPQLTSEKWVISYGTDKWKITCPSSIRRGIDKPLPLSPSDRF